MIYQKINLKDYYKELKYNPTLEIMVPELTDGQPYPPFPVGVVLPGGGYGFVSKRECDPVVINFLKNGYASCSLTYTVTPNLLPGDKLYPHPYLEVMAAIDYMKKHAEEWHLDVNKIVVTGFSAGGHLAASYGYMYKIKEFQKLLGISEENCKPNYVIAAYPVITFSQSTHGGSRDNLSSGDANLLERLSVEKNITPDYPPAFIWNTLEDSCVPPTNSNLYAEALAKNGVDHELVQFERGWHGLSIMDRTTFFTREEREQYKEQATWFDRAIAFLDKQYAKK